MSAARSDASRCTESLGEPPTETRVRAATRTLRIKPRRRSSDAFAKRRLELVLIRIRDELDLERHANSTPLTQREREVLDLVAQGCTSREIGDRLGIAAGTVDCEVNGAMAKLTARTRTHAALLAATPAAPPGPLFVLEEPSAEISDALVRELANAGWDVRRDWEILGSTNGIAPPSTVCVGTVRSTEDARSALAVAVSGAGLIVSAHGPLLERLIGELHGLCARREKSLSDEERRLLALLAAGISISEAARRLYISRRTAERRLRAARRALGVRTTTEAVIAVASRRKRWLQIVRAS